MKFRTEIPLPKYPFSFEPKDKIMLLGSCFTTHIGTFFQKSGIDVSINPFGTLFNPFSIATGLQLLANPDTFGQQFIYWYDNYYVSFAHSSSFSCASEHQLRQEIGEQLHCAQQFLYKSQYLFITFGTAFCYKFKERDLIVANCHKIPQAQFEKIALSVDEIVELWSLVLDWIEKECSGLKVIFTVSPVRHLSDGFHENTLSKATLHLAIDRLMCQYTAYYFPAFEILHDDLRDYRYYHLDLCHPSESAIQYISECADQVFFSDTTRAMAADFRKADRLQHHRPVRGTHYPPKSS